MTTRRSTLVLALTLPWGFVARGQEPTPAAPAAGPQTHQLLATPKTVAWGHYSAKTPPVLTIKSGDAVEVRTLLTSSPTRLEGAGVAPADVEPALRAIYNEVKDKGPGGPHPHRTDLRRGGRAGRHSGGPDRRRSSWSSPTHTTPSAGPAAPSPKTSPSRRCGSSR